MELIYRPRYNLLVAVLVTLACAGHVHSQSNDTLTSESRLEYDNYYGGYTLEMYDTTDTWVKVCYDDFWNHDTSYLARKLCDSIDYQYGYIYGRYMSGTHAVYHVKCSATAETIGECSTTALYYQQDCDRYVTTDCYSKKPFYETNLTATIAMCSVAGVMVLSGIVFVIVRTRQYTKREQQHVGDSQKVLT